MNLAPITPEQRAAGLAKRATERAAWPAVRQPHADDRDYLRAILKRNGLSRIPPEEPATARRLAFYLRRAGLDFAGIRDALGPATPAGKSAAQEYVRRNPGVALWWLVAGALESAGR
jgi:hypothetical protein